LHHYANIVSRWEHVKWNTETFWFPGAASRDAVDKPSLELEFIANLDVIKPKKRVGGLNLPNPVNNPFVKRRKPPAAALVEANGVGVVVGCGEVDAFATVGARVLLCGG
jgi:hypothetical protein